MRPPGQTQPQATPRSKQTTVLHTEEDKALFEAGRRHMGARSLSEFFRTLGLQYVTDNALTLDTHRP